MESGFYNSCFINKKKTVKNFGDNSINSICFYGISINTNTLELSGNYDCYKGVNIFHTISFRSRDRPGEFLKNRMRFLNSLKLNDMYLNPIINSKKTILLNVLRASLLHAFRFHAIVTHLFNSYNSNMLIGSIKEFAVQVTSRVVRVAKEFGATGSSVIDKHMVVWTVYKGFDLKLGKEHTKFPYCEEILSFLKQTFLILFSQLNKDDQDLLRDISKYKMSNDFKGTR